MSKIALVVTRSELGGAQEYLRILMQAMRQGERHSPMLVSGDSGFLTGAAEELGVPVHICPHLVRPIRPWQDLRAIVEMTLLFRREKPDLVHANSSKAGIVARIAALLAGIPVVFTAHGWSFTEGIVAGQARIYRWLEKAAAPLAQKIICVSGFDHRLALAAGVGRPEQLVTVHNGIPDAAPVMKKENAVPVLMMVARFSESKDYDTVLRALGLLKDYPCILQCVGDGPLLEYVQQLTLRLGLGDRVRFLGARRDVAALLAQADIGVLGSHWEGLPLSILESMRAGLPVVATRVGGVPEAVHENVTGLLVEPQDHVGMAKALAVLLSQPELRRRMGRAGRQRFLDMFTAERMVAATLGVYEEALAGRRRQPAVMPVSGRP